MDGWVWMDISGVLGFGYWVLIDGGVRSWLWVGWSSALEFGILDTGHGQYGLHTYSSCWVPDWIYTYLF